ncbi:MAG: hypothetical protein JXA37_10680 [Chloroflexia bacterium]|nr:hypothetical protein [Chloroflexia bacterium]
MSKKRRKKPARRQLPSEQDTVYISEYEITSEPLSDRRYDRLPDRVKEAFEQLYHLAQRRPRQAIPELLEWIEKYPKIPMLYNYLSVAYSRTGQSEEMEAIVEENYRRNPDYLFARLNYAQLCLAKGDYEQVAAILEHKFDLKRLYPKRKRFHISEVANFMGLIGLYFLGIGERDVAEKYYELLKQIAPKYPMTRQLRRQLFPNFLQRLLLRWSGQQR